MAEIKILDDLETINPNSWVILAKFNSSDDPTLFMLANELENEEIMSHTLDKGFNMMGGIFNGKDGVTELYVLRKDLIKATEILNVQIEVKNKIYDDSNKGQTDWSLWSIFAIVIIVLFVLGFINKTTLFNF